MFDHMKKPVTRHILTCFFSILLFIACRKDGLITSPDALLFTSADTLSFGKLFTGSGSITQSFKIFNGNEQRLLLSSIRLAGGATSSYQMNVNGVPGTDFSNIEIAGGDSIYVFVSAFVPPSGEVLPFLVRDSISIEWNNNQSFVQLTSEGRNARWLEGGTIATDSVFTNDLPIVIKGSLTIAAGATLTIEEGTSVFFDANAALIIEGSLHALGNLYDSTRITFSGSRLDEPYNLFPGSWPGLIFSKTSFNNKLDYVNIQNGVSGIRITGNGVPQLSMNGCIIDNQAEYGIYAVNSGVSAINCQITNCQFNNIYLAGGFHFFTHCTVVTYSNLLISHDGPVAFFTDQDDELNQYFFSVVFTNCIFFGSGGLVDNEVSTSVNGSMFSALMRNVFYYNSTELPGLVFENSINSTEPAFNNLDFENNIFDFSLSTSSPCNNTGAPTAVSVDILGRNRNSLSPDMGCFENE